MHTPSGRVDCTTTPVQPDPRFTAAIFLDTIEDRDLDRVLAEMPGLYRTLHAEHPLSLAVYAGHEWKTAGPFRSLPQLRASLNQFLKRAAAPDTYSNEQLYEILANSAVQFGSGWASVVFIGRFPQIDTDMKDYAVAYLAFKYRAQRLRVSYWPVAGEESSLLGPLARITGGATAHVGLDEITDKLSRDGAAVEIACTEPVLDRGFELYHAARLDPAGNVTEDIPSLVIALGRQPVDLEHYTELRKVVRSTAELIGQPATQELLDRIRSGLQAAFALNPADPEALRLAIDFYKRYNDHKTATVLLSLLTETDPLNPAVLAEAGHERFIAGDADGAEKVLLQSREMRPVNPRVAEDLARIQLGRKNYASALPLLEESLRADAKNAELWYLRADTATKVDDWVRAEDSLEHGLAADASQLARRTALVRLYLDHGQTEQALRHVQVVVNGPSVEASVWAAYAEFLEELQRPDDAVSIWQKAIAGNAKLEKAHYHLSRLLLNRSNFTEAVAAAEAGIAIAPNSGRLYLVKSEAIEKHGDFYEARRVLRTASASVDEAPLLLRLAEMEDTSGPDAARAYMRAAKALQVSSPASHEYQTAIERGLLVTARDGDEESGAWFSAQLDATGKHPNAIFSEKRNRATQNGVWVPGGLEALAFVARSKPHSPPELFFENYCRTVHSATDDIERKTVEAYLGPIRDHFRLVAAIEALGEREGHTVKISLSLQDKAARRRTEQFVNLLGWKLHANKQGVTVEAGEKAAQAKRQETASALAIDEVGLQEALQNGQSYKVEITDVWAPLILSEEIWRNTFYPKQQFAGGFAEAIAYEPRMAKVYVGLTRLNQNTSSVILAGIGLKQLAEKYGDLFCEYSSSLALENGRAAVPGGAAAEPVWRKLAGVDPMDPSHFFQALFEKDDGKLLAFYATLSQLDAQHQHFFTLNVSRTGKFYDLLRETPEFARGIVRDLRENSFIEFLRGVPLDTDGEVVFPGSPEVWMVAKGRSDAARAGKLTKKLAKVVAPDEEDEILLRLARTRYHVEHLHASELDNFLAVAHIDAHRSTRLDEPSALLLAQSYSEARELYSYFAVLTGLQLPQFQQLVALTEKLRTAPNVEKNLVLGELHSLIQLLCLGREGARITEEQSTALLTMICDRFLKSPSPAEYASASLDVTRAIIGMAGGQSRSPDDAIREMLLGRPFSVRVELDGQLREIDPVKAREAEYQQVLDLQKVPALTSLYAIYDTATRLSAGQGNSAESATAMETAASSLPDVPLPKKQKLDGPEKANLERFQPKRTHEIIARIREKAQKKKTNPKDVQKLCQELLAETNPQVTLALAGIVYAYYLRPIDLLVSEDPLLLRKHRFKDFDGTQKELMFPASELRVDSQGLGSYVKGGFGTFSMVAGSIAAANAKSEGNNEAILRHQLGSLRATPWNVLSDQDLRMAGLKVRLAREWIIEAATHPEVRTSLADATLGLLSRSRRVELLNAVETRDWKTAWSAVTLSDLYFLAERYLSRNKTDLWQSPVTANIRLELNRPYQLHPDLLGSSLPSLFACDHPHMMFLAPYEEYERYLIPDKLAERTAELKLYLAVSADNEGIPAAALGMIAETLARKMLGGIKMSDLRDWPAIPAALSSVDASTWKVLLQ